MSREPQPVHSIGCLRDMWWEYWRDSVLINLNCQGMLFPHHKVAIGI
jgi:hypothetical protein